LKKTKKYKVTVTEPAEDMLLKHAVFLAQVSIDAADRLFSRFDHIIARIADNPYQFPLADKLDTADIFVNTYRKCRLKIATRRCSAWKKTKCIL